MTWFDIRELYILSKADGMIRLVTGVTPVAPGRNRSGSRSALLSRLVIVSGVPCDDVNATGEPRDIDVFE